MSCWPMKSWMKTDEQEPDSQAGVVAKGAKDFIKQVPSVF